MEKLADTDNNVVEARGGRGLGGGRQRGRTGDISNNVNNTKNETEVQAY